MIMPEVRGSVLTGFNALREGIQAATEVDTRLRGGEGRLHLALRLCLSVRH